MPDFKLVRGSVQERFLASRAKIQLFAGGYAGGKTATMCIKAIQLSEMYPGSNGLIARETYPKLNDTIRKEFVKWCPEDWIERWFTKDDNTIILANGTTINFRYVKQQAKTEGGTSNLLSATYDWILVDQIEDPGILEKDFLDLLGRLRGSTRYIGDDLTMPLTGPRWLIASCNPSRNWVFRKLVKPLHTYKETKYKSPDLMVDKSGEPIIELFEGSTYDNADNLEPDYIETLEAAYQGQMRDRFLKGNWSAYEGLVFPMYDETIHRIPHDQLVRYLHRLRMQGFRPTIVEAYDHGIAKPGCYMLAFGDHKKNLLILDGHYEKELAIGDWSNIIEDKRELYSILSATAVKADPAIFKRASQDKKVVGKTVAQIYEDCGIWMTPGDNGITSGIAKCRAYLQPLEFHRHPLYNTDMAPHLYVSDHLDWFDSEITDYFWKKDTAGQDEDTPTDKNDHAMNTMKYLLSDEPEVASFIKHKKETPDFMYWQEHQDEEGNRIPARRRAS